MITFCKKQFNKLTDELVNYLPEEKAFVLFAMVCGFFICCDYSIIRPISNSLFIESFSARALPYAWLSAIPLNFALVSLYNRLVVKWGSRKLFLRVIIVVMSINLFLSTNH